MCYVPDAPRIGRWRKPLSFRWLRMPARRLLGGRSRQRRFSVALFPVKVLGKEIA
jgi:hypothetical protein